MNWTIALNQMSAHAASSGWSMLWQSSALILVVLGLDYALRGRLRASTRYALWLLVLVKLALPPSLAAPSGLAWWIRGREPVPTAAVAPSPLMKVRFGTLAGNLPPPAVSSAAEASREPLSNSARLVTGTLAVTAGLLGWMLVRWRKVALEVRRSAPAPAALERLLDELRATMGIRRAVRLRLVEGRVSPALCGLFRPVIILPKSLAGRLAPERMRAVLTHELVHLRRGDLWVNCGQAVLQALYWWHPLVWVANARMRAAREEAVDDAVMLSLGEEAGVYAPALLEVAKFYVRRPLASLGLVGILESPGALRRRVTRLLDFHPPRKAGIGMGALALVVAFGAVALPMGPGPGDSPSDTSKLKPDMEEKTPVTTEVPPQKESSARRAAVLVRDAKLLYEMGKLREAKSRLAEALKLNPGNEAAAYYSNLIGEAEAKREEWISARERERDSGRDNEDPFSRADALYTRVFKVDPEALVENLRERMGLPADERSVPLREFLESNGVELEAPKTLYFNRREGSVLVRATLRDLDRFETLLQEIAASPLQLNIKVQLLELTREAALRVWGRSASGPMAAILDPKAAADTLGRVKSMPGVRVISEGSVTTLSGRQAQLQWGEVRTVVSKTNGNSAAPDEPPSEVGTNQVFVGAMVDLFAVANADGRRVQVTVSADNTELLGYDHAGGFMPQGASAPSTAPPVPAFRVRKIATIAGLLLDGQTFAVGDLSETRTRDVASTGRGAVTGRPGTDPASGKRLAAFITPVLIDPAGNPLRPLDSAPKKKSSSTLPGGPVELVHPTIPPKPAGGQ